MITQQCALLVLAAGEGKRMGKAKQLLSYKNTTLLGHSLKTALDTQIGDVYCVLGAHFQQTSMIADEYDVEIIQNQDWRKGLGRSIAMGVKHILEHQPNTSLILVMLADQPNIKPNYLTAMLKLALENDENLIATQYPGRAGVPAVFPSPVFNHLSQLKGDKGAKEFINSYPNVLSVALDADATFDVDTEYDYQVITQ